MCFEMSEQFSVLMAVYKNDKASYLRKSLESIYQQSSLPTEIVLVLDGPVGSEIHGVVEAYSNDTRIKLNIVAYGTNRGLWYALNIGLKECHTDLIFRMDADDVAYTDRFSKQLEYFRSNTEVKIVGGQITEFVGSEANIERSRSVPLSKGEIIKFAKKRNPLNHMTVAFKKEFVWETLGGYRNYTYFEDYELWVRALLNDDRSISNISDYLVNVRTDGMVLRRSGWGYITKMMRFEHHIWNEGFLSTAEFVRVVFARICGGLMPKMILNRLYSKFLRS